MADDNIKPEDLILLLLNSDGSKPIKGNVMITKEVFLSVREIFKNAELEKVFEFFPYRLGMYSTVLFKLLDQLEEKRLLTIRKTPDGDLTYEITSEGKAYIAGKVGAVNKETINRLNNMKKIFHQRGYNSLLRYVYEKYPEYIIKSEIKDRVLSNL